MAGLYHRSRDEMKQKAQITRVRSPPQHSTWPPVSTPQANRAPVESVTNVCPTAAWTGTLESVVFPLPSWPNWFRPAGWRTDSHAIGNCAVRSAIIIVQPLEVTYCPALLNPAHPSTTPAPGHPWRRRSRRHRRLSETCGLPLLLAGWLSFP